MNNFITQLVTEHLMEVVVVFITTTVTPFLVSVLRSARQRIDESTIVQKLDKEGKLREALDSAIKTAVDSGLQSGLTEAQIIHQKVKYVQESVPDSVRQLGATTSIIQDKLQAALTKAIRAK